MHKHVGALVLIFLGASFAWFILGGTLVQRTDASDTAQQAQLSGQWGTPQIQKAPEIFADTGPHKRVAVPIRSSNIDVGLNLEQRRKGLLWYNLYDVQFSARYVVRNDTTSNHLAIRFPLPVNGGSYADLRYAIDGHRIDTATVVDGDRIDVALAPGQRATLDVGYRSRGSESWTYQFKNGVESVNDFTLTMTTNFKAIDFPPQTLLPVSEESNGNGWRLQWKYGTLVTANAIGMVIPYPLQPGPLAQRITFWAPVALLFYLFVMLLITTLRGIDLHPVNYFFITCAFFAFHLLFAYLVDRIPLLTAFVICSLVSMFLTISYLRLVAGWRFAAVESGLAQLVYLILFSYALFNEGWSGLTITTGAIVTLFVAMQATGRIRWSERLAASV
jgi:hypothetical protein